MVHRQLMMTLPPGATALRPCVQEVRPGVWLLPSAELAPQQQQQQQGQRQPPAQGWARAASSEGAARS
jgi:hypothetical protein